MIEHDLPIHFFTIVLNGQPFIRYHLDVFRALPFRWHWHVVEGVAALAHDTAWSVAAGGRIDDTLHSKGLSNDGTSQYLDRIAGEFPHSITLYRKAPGSFWDGKREMVAAPLANVQEPCLLWEVDADELWRPEQISAMRRMFQMQPGRTAAFYWCDYFVGPDLVITTRYNYAQNPAVEWLRTWRFVPGMQWFAHEPPTLIGRESDGRLVNVAAVAPFTHDETEALGARFQHFSYATEEQLRFKQIYYAEGDLNAWRRMNMELRHAKFLRDYFPWVRDFTMVDRSARASVVPWAEPLSGGDWRFLSTEEIGRRKRERKLPRPRIVLDCTLSPMAPAKLNETWLALLREWAATGFRDHVVLLDRGGSTARIEGICYRSIPFASEDEPDMLQRVCDELDATLFLTARNFTARVTPVVLLHGLNSAPGKIARSANVSAHLVLSEQERQFLLGAHPHIDPARVITVGTGRDAPDHGVRSVEAALREIAAQL
jgi:hypothetical protein